VTKPKARPDLPIFLNAAETEALLRISPRTRAGLVHTGKLPAFTVGPRGTRHLLSDVLALLTPIAVEPADTDDTEVAS